ncbi:hypothetical protein CWATWH0402_5275 [Crocosphaera watsonii WH 0402]|uniref:Uncharacterized protein n=1 Tax=Crocosphaera watsonii WH 0402 TaxID=1284629 RepID=T2JZH4_CROWT|nr:hypothetical protein CWATWH0402_5275 [Crocosphaera watsonii WH 0402]
MIADNPELGNNWAKGLVCDNSLEVSWGENCKGVGISPKLSKVTF